jgi:hypothetical protein
MFELKPISAAAVPEALEKAMRYRLLNEPFQAESICLDILRIEPENQQALAVLLLSRTDQFAEGVNRRKAQQIIEKLSSLYEREYFAGIICERWAEWLLHQGTPGAGFTAHSFFTDAMQHYERAETMRPEGNDDAILRWNTCARLIMQNPEVRPRPSETFEPAFDD